MDMLLLKKQKGYGPPSPMRSPDVFFVVTRPSSHDAALPLRTPSFLSDLTAHTHSSPPSLLHIAPYLTPCVLHPPPRPDPPSARLLFVNSSSIANPVLVASSYYSLGSILVFLVVVLLFFLRRALQLVN
jgi:hypothetical protein